jgi:hypothetical protein
MREHYITKEFMNVLPDIVGGGGYVPRLGWCGHIAGRGRKKLLENSGDKTGIAVMLKNE